MPYPDPARRLNKAELAAFTARMKEEVGAVMFNKDDAESIRAALRDVRRVIEITLWPHRENRQAVRACRSEWMKVLDALFAYRHRARLSNDECCQLAQWWPAPWIGPT